MSHSAGADAGVRQVFVGEGRCTVGEAVAAWTRDVAPGKRRQCKVLRL